MSRYRYAVLLLLGFLLPVACDNPLVPNRAASVSLGESRIYVVPGQEVQLTANVRDAAGNVLTGRRVAWRSLAPPVASVSESGLLTAHRVGSVWIEATVDGRTGSVEVFVMDDGLHVWPDTSAMRPGETRELAARARIERSPVRVLSGIVWESSDPSVAAVDTTGVVTAVAEGHATITAIAGPTRITAEAYVLPEGEPLEFASVAVSRGFWTAICGLTLDGEAYCWGASLHGLLGAVRPTDRCEYWIIGGAGVFHEPVRCSDRPVPVAPGLRFESLSLGGRHACGVVTGGEVYCWGSDYGGQLGRGTRVGTDPTPAPAAGGLKFQSVTAGSEHTCAVSVENDGYCWGWNNWGQAGDGTGETGAAPTAVAGDLSFARIEAGALHTCGVTLDGVAYCWGRNQYGELGSGESSGSLAPLPVATELRFAALDVGGGVSCGLGPEGDAHCWGSGSRGRLGNGSELDSPVPVPVQQPVGLVTLSVGREQACGLDAAGAIYCWGAGVLHLDGSTPAATLVASRSAPADPVGRVDVTSHTCWIALDGGAYCVMNGAALAVPGSQ